MESNAGRRVCEKRAGRSGQGRAQGRRASADNIVPILFTITVVKMKDQYVMFDSGTGGQVQPTAGLMASKT